MIMIWIISNLLSKGCTFIKEVRFIISRCYVIPQCIDADTEYWSISSNKLLPLKTLILCIKPWAPIESHLQILLLAPDVIVVVNFKYDSVETNVKLFLVGILIIIVSPAVALYPFVPFEEQYWLLYFLMKQIQLFDHILNFLEAFVFIL